MSNFNGEEAKTQLEFTEEESRGEHWRQQSCLSRKWELAGELSWKQAFLLGIDLEKGEILQPSPWVCVVLRVLAGSRWQSQKKEAEETITEVRAYLWEAPNGWWITGCSSKMEIPPGGKSGTVIWIQRRGFGARKGCKQKLEQSFCKPRSVGRDCGWTPPLLLPATFLCAGGASPCLCSSGIQSTREPGWCFPQRSAPEQGGEGRIQSWRSKRKTSCIAGERRRDLMHK